MTTREGAARRSPATAAVLLAALLSLSACPAAEMPPGGQTPPAQATLEGRVTQVFDGDSFRMRVSGRGIIEVRMADIDAPERHQPHAEESRAALKRLLDGQRIRVSVREQDRYRRSVGRVYRLPESLDINADQVRLGHAWVYRRHLQDQSLLALEREARTARRGLWALPREQTVPPWVWRKQHPPKRQSPPPPAP